MVSLQHWSDGVLIWVVMSAAAACSTPTEPTFAGYAEPRVTTPVIVSGRALAYPSDAALPSAVIAFGNLDFSGRFVADVTAIANTLGAYTASVRPGSYLVAVGARTVGTVRILETGTPRGDLLVNPGPCVARYGVIADANSHRPLAGVTVKLGGRSATSESDGWYRIDLGCSGGIGFNTTFIYFDLPGYPTHCQVVGRGIDGVERIDFFLSRRAPFRGGILRC